MLTSNSRRLTSEQAAEARVGESSEKSEWVDAKVTAGHQLPAPENAQLPENSQPARQLGRSGPQCARWKCVVHFRSAASQLTRIPPLFNRYPRRTILWHTRGQRHSSGNWDGTSHRMNRKCYFSQPDEYEGGELVVEDTYGLHKEKLPAGHMILYPSTSLDHVLCINRRGARISSFF